MQLVFLICPAILVIFSAVLFSNDGLFDVGWLLDGREH